MTNRQTDSWYHNFSVWLDPLDRNPAHFTSVGYLTPEPFLLLA